MRQNVWGVLKKASLVYLAILTLVSVFAFVADKTSAAISPSPAYAASMPVGGLPNQTLRYEITLTRTATFSHLVLPLPANAGTSGLQIGGSSLRAGKLERVTGGFVFRTTAPYTIAAGTRVWVMINGITMPPAGTYPVRITAYDTSGAIISVGDTPGLKVNGAKPCTAHGSDYIRNENSLAGSTAWRLNLYDNAVAHGYASQTSAKCGDTVTLRINSSAIETNVVAYRMGYYGGSGARAISATRTPIRGYAQPALLMVTTDDQGREINMPTARNWSQTYSVKIDGSFTPGSYLFKVTDAQGNGSYIPLTVRDDTGHHDKLLLNSVATWQAYNKFGGASAYTTPIQSKRVSYDRPLLQNQGTGDFLSLEYGFIYWAEKQGYDMNYAPDTDLHSRPYLYDNANTLVLMAHTEYWSTAMRAKVDQAVAAGKNIASFGANQLYWRINPKPSALTGTDREYEVFRTGDTVRFRDDPNPNPEQKILGAMYGCLHMVGGANPNGTWLWNGVAKTFIPNLAAGEVDKVQPGHGELPGREVLTTMTLDACKRNPPDEELPYADIVAVDHVGVGGRVFNASTHSWGCMLHGFCPWAWSVTPTAMTQLSQATSNVFNWINAGPQVFSQESVPADKPIQGVLQPKSGMPPLEYSSED